MSYHHLLRSTAEDRDLTRAAAERYLMLQALSERQHPPPAVSHLSRLKAIVQAVRVLRPSSSSAPIRPPQDAAAE
jgi:hypothetical protein